MSQNKQARARKVAAFRALHDRPGAFVIPNPWDVGSAKILESLGFEALATSSGALAWTRGKVDGRATPDEVIDHCRDLCQSTSTPISADLGPGFGDAPDAVADTIRQAAETGLAGGSIEDAADPYMGGTYDFDHAVERVAAAVDAASGVAEGFVLTARCEHFTRGPGDFDDMLKRLKAYEAAGADVLYAPGLADLEQIRTVCQSVSKPVNVLTGFRGMDVAPDDLEAAGVKRISLGTDLARIAYGALLRAGEELKEKRSIADHDVAARSSEIMQRFL